MGKIFCLIGKSSSGKDTISKMLLLDEELNLKPVIPYTTRPKRHNESEGLEYHFVAEELVTYYRKKGKIIEQRDYNTTNGRWSYCTIDDGQINLSEDNYYLLIATLESYKDLQNYFGPNNVIPLYVEIEDGVRLLRAINREKQQSQPNYEELCRRFIADSNDFSKHNLKYFGVDTYYLNENISECINNIKTDILSVMLETHPPNSVDE
ncbi:MAG: guanylate kinase [Desulfosporosinus sp.]|nr:guanylate kinase [Desulfosporosinus sp.]